MRTSMRCVTLMRMHKKTTIESRRRIVSHSHTACQLQHQLGCWVALGLATAGAIATAAATRRLSTASACNCSLLARQLYKVGTLCSLWFSCSTRQAPTPAFFLVWPRIAYPIRQLATEYQYISIVYMYACCLQPQRWFMLIYVHAGASIGYGRLQKVPITTYSGYIDSIPALKL